jgi:hypothetical protein
MDKARRPRSAQRDRALRHYQAAGGEAERRHSSQRARSGAARRWPRWRSQKVSAALRASEGGRRTCAPTIRACLLSHPWKWGPLRLKWQNPCSAAFARRERPYFGGLRGASVGTAVIGGTAERAQEGEAAHPQAAALQLESTPEGVHRSRWAGSPGATRAGYGHRTTAGRAGREDEDGDGPGVFGGALRVAAAILARAMAGVVVMGLVAATLPA